MSCCCTSVLKLCDVIVCDDQPLVLPIPIPADGDYVLELQFLGDVIRKRATLSLGNNATFDKDDLNERFTYVAHVEDAAGEHLSFTLDNVVYDCVEFTTKRVL